MSTIPVNAFEQMRRYFLSGATRDYGFRRNQLLQLRKAIKQYEAELNEALYKDLHKSPEEAYATEIGFLYAEISHALSHLKSWMEPQKVSSPIVLFPSSGKILREPLGVCLIIAPWNYPFQLLVAPLIGAIAAGNCAILKPSEYTTHTAAVIERMIGDFFERQYITVVQGEGHIVVPQLMNDNRFDHVFFTGSIPVGREIAKLAAPKLVSVTLELGGKSPCIVDEDANIEVAAQRITWGKFTNVGQTCVAPDYLLVHRKIKDELTVFIEKSIQKFYGEDPQASPDYGRIINQQRFEKLESYLTNGKVIVGGNTIKEDLYFSPTILDEVGIEEPVMNEEIFGPILPVLTFQTHEEALEIIKRNPNPLSLYYFGNNKKAEKLYIESVAFGGGCVNNTLVHLGNSDLPFGGVGNSGVGAYHGKFSFDIFSRQKAIVKTGTWLDPPAKYPPYKGKMQFLKWLLR